jgi:hypothetical protein
MGEMQGFELNRRDSEKRHGHDTPSEFATPSERAKSERNWQDDLQDC